MEKPYSATAEALVRAHRALVEDLRKLEDAVRPGSAESLAELRARLGPTYTDVCEHFRFEEQNGYMDEVQKREPQSERIVQQLTKEHRDLRQSLDSLIGEARTTNIADDVFRERIRNWIERVRHHEARENELVQDAFNWDIAAED